MIIIHRLHRQARCLRRDPYLPGRCGGALGGTRTPNLLIRSQMLYPLSYERLGLTDDSEVFECMRSMVSCGIAQRQRKSGRCSRWLTPPMARRARVVALVVPLMGCLLEHAPQRGSVGGEVRLGGSAVR